jgi:outer membrane cobalamin receptor
VRLSSLKKTVKVVVNLVHKARVLDAVEIAGRTDEIVESGEKVGHFVINPNELASLPNMGEVDIFQSLKFLPGISTSNDNSQSLSIRGSTGDQNLLLLDGYSLYKQDHCFGMFSAINANAIKNIQVFRGGFESKYGGKVGGVIDITGKSGNRFKPSGHFGINMISADMMVEAPLFKKKGSFIIAGRRSFTDILQTPLYKEVFNSLFADNELLILNIGDNQHVYDGQIDPRFFFYDLNAKISYNPSDKDVISVSVYTGNDELEIKDKGIDYFNYVSSGNTGISAKWARQWNKEYYSQVLFSHSYYYNIFSQSYEYYDTTSVLQNTVSDNYNSIYETKVKNDNEWQINSKSTLEFGLELDRTEIVSNSSFSDTGEINSFDQTANLATGYFQYTYQPFHKIKVVPGVRLNYFEGTNKFYAEPRLSVFAYLTDHFNLKAAVGKYNQFISRLSVPDQYGGYSYFWALADNLYIPVISANHYVVGFNYHKGSFSIDAEFYRKDIQGLTEFRYVYDTIWNDFGVNYFSGQAVIEGMDIMVKNQFGSFTGWISYSLSKNTNRFNELNMGNPFPSNNNKKHELKIVGMLKINNWDLSSSWVYNSGLPYSKPSVDASSFYFIPIDEINTHTLPDFHRLDVSITYNYSYRKIWGNVGLSIMNVYNRKNVKSILSFLEYNNDESLYIPVSINYPGFAPSLFLNINF